MCIFLLQRGKKLILGFCRVEAEPDRVEARIYTYIYMYIHIYVYIYILTYVYTYIIHMY